MSAGAVIRITRPACRASRQRVRLRREAARRRPDQIGAGHPECEARASVRHGLRAPGEAAAAPLGGAGVRRNRRQVRRPGAEPQVPCRQPGRQLGDRYRTTKSPPDRAAMRAGRRRCRPGPPPGGRRERRPGRRRACTARPTPAPWARPGPIARHRRQPVVHSLVPQRGDDLGELGQGLLLLGAGFVRQMAEELLHLHGQVAGIPSRAGRVPRPCHRSNRHRRPGSPMRPDRCSALRRT